MFGKHALHKCTTQLLILLLGVGFLAAGPAQGQATDPPVPGEGGEDNQKLAQASMKFTSISVSPRASALGNATTSLRMGSLSMFYNPAAMARTDRSMEASIGSVQWIADIRHDYASLAYSPSEGKYGVFGVLVRSVNYGKVHSTIRADNEQGYIETGVIKPTAIEAGVSYAMAVTSNFSVGGTAKWAQQNLGASTTSSDSESGSRETRSITEGAPVFDFGVRYQPGFRSLTIGMNARNFSSEVSYGERSFELPLDLRMGLSVDLMDFTKGVENHSFRVSVDANVPRDFLEQIKFGGEYEFMDVLALRAGYVIPDRSKGIRLGGGLRTKISGLLFRVDYSFVRFDRLNNVNRFGVSVGF